MAGFKIDLFKGLRPRISALKLPRGEAVTAENLKLGDGDLEPLTDKSTERVIDPSRDPGTIFLYDNDGSPVWFEWNDRVDVVRGPIKDDTFDRVYYSGDQASQDRPKLTTNTLADLAGGGPYPESWLYLGVPAPTVAPTVSDVSLPEDVPQASRFANNFKTDEFVIDRVRYTVYPGTGTDNDTWRLNAGALGSIAFDVLLGTSFRVTEVINGNKVILESATEPGITIRTQNSDKTTVNDWHPMDEQGSTKEADFIGWRIPPGMTVTIPGHQLSVGDVIAVSAINRLPEYFAALTTDLFAQSWEPEITVNESGTDFEQHEDARISISAVSGDSQFGVTGSFYYDVDRASSITSELEDRTYVYTYVNCFGEEGPPSPPSLVQPQLDGKSVLISDMELPPTIGYDITKMRLYRTNSTEAGTEFQFVQEFDVSVTTRDEVLSEDLAEVIATTTWDPPPELMRGLTALPNGMLVGFKGKQIYMCEPYFPHAWPPEYDQAVGYDIVAIAALGNSAVILTEGWPYILTGSHPRNANLKPIKENQACISKESVATDGDRAYYASYDGLIEIDQTGLRIVTEQYMTAADWAAFSPETMIGEFYEGRYHGFWGFDDTAVDPFISAEVSGTVVNASESDIVNGGLTVILTLMNDNWVTAGAAFNAQRQNIIDGLTSSSVQTLGWNNIIRDTELGVGDVVRTSDTVVTITLPAAATYAITSAEPVQPTIPASALENSNAAVATGSTFSVTPDPVVATVTMSGSLTTEAEVVAGGETIILTLTNDTWIDSADFTDALINQLIQGLQSTTDEPDGWNDLVPQEIDVADVVRTSDLIMTITLDAVPLYDVIANETITALVPHELLVTTEDVNVPSSNSIGIAATGAASALFSGTAIDGGVTENEIIAGTETIIITLTNDTWIAAGTGPIGTTAQSQALIDALIAQTSQTNGWNNEVVSAITVATDLVRTSATVATITLPAVAAYSIASNETVGMDIPNAVLTTEIVDLTVSNTFGITAQTPVTAILSGTVTASIDENDIVAGGKTIILTLSNDTWLVAGTGPIGSTANTQAIIDGITSAQSEANGWNNIVRDTDLSPTDVVRTSDTVATITLPASATYNITAQETIESTIPAAALNIAALAVVASPTFTVDFDVAASIVVSGTADESNDDDIRTGGKTIILTVSDDTWVASGATFEAQRQNIIDGLDAASSPTNGWNNEVRDGTLGVTDVVRTSDTVVTITLPATPLYEAGADEVITVTVPDTALEDSAIAVVGTPVVNIRDLLDTTVMAAITPKSVATSRETYFAIATDSFTDWTEDSVDADTAVSGPTTVIMTYAGNDSKWLIGTRLDTDPFAEMEIFESTDDGANWTSSYVTSGGGDPFLNNLYWHPDADIVVCATPDDDKLVYSVNGGSSWSASTTPLAASTRTGGFGGLKIDYSGTLRLASQPYAVTDGMGGYTYQYMYSPDLTTPGDVGNAWTEETLTFDGSISDTGNMMIGNGNGKTFFLLFDFNGGTYDVYISYITHGSTTENYVGKLTGLVGGSAGIPYASAASEDRIEFIMNDTYLVGCDLGGAETTIGNWEFPTTTAIGSRRIAGSVDIRAMIWDPGAAAPSEGLGFVAVGENETTDFGVVYTSPDGTTWTLQDTSALDDSRRGAVAAVNPPDVS